MKKYILYSVAALFIAFILFIFFRPKQILSAEVVKAKYTLPSSHFIKWRGGELHYTDEGSGFPILMIHGFGGSHRNFNRIASLLKDRYRVIRVDLPGFGMSDLPKEGEDRLNPAIVYPEYMRFITDTLGLDSFYVMGNSMGGWMAWQTTVDYPEKVKGLVLLGSAGYEMENIKAKVVKLLRTPLIAKALERGMPYAGSENAASRCWSNDDLIDPNETQANNDFWNREGNIQAALLIANTNVQPDTSAICKLNCPTLIVWGKEDEIIPEYHSQKFHRDIKNSNVIVYDKCGHIPQAEMADQLEKDFLKFIGEINGTRMTGLNE